MKTKKPRSRTGASKPRETGHLREAQKQSLDIQAEAEHTDGEDREKLTRQMAKER